MTTLIEVVSISSGQETKWIIKGCPKRRPQSWEGGLSRAGIFQTKRVQMRTSALFGAKNFWFFEICGVSAQVWRV